MQLQEIRKNYQYGILNESDIKQDPFEQFNTWLAEAMNHNESEPTAMTIATVDENNRPHARMVLLKEIIDRKFYFFTNYESHKAEQLYKNKHVALVFYWASLERQVRIEGMAEKADEEIAIAYFQTRPLESQLGAWASPQSQIISSRQILEQRIHQYREKFGNQIPKPPFWGGFQITPILFEFWQGRPNRLHDRIEYVHENDHWNIHRLAP